MNIRTVSNNEIASKSTDSSGAETTETKESITLKIDFTLVQMASVFDTRVPHKNSTEILVVLINSDDFNCTTTLLSPATQIVSSLPLSFHILHSEV